MVLEPLASDVLGGGLAPLLLEPFMMALEPLVSVLLFLGGRTVFETEGEAGPASVASTLRKGKWGLRPVFETLGLEPFFRLALEPLLFLGGGRVLRSVFETASASFFLEPL